MKTAENGHRFRSSWANRIRFCQLPSWPSWNCPPGGLKISGEDRISRYGYESKPFKTPGARMLPFLDPPLDVAGWCWMVVSGESHGNDRWNPGGWEDEWWWEWSPLDDRTSGKIREKIMVNIGECDPWHLGNHYFWPKRLDAYNRKDDVSMSGLGGFRFWRIHSESRGSPEWF